jgi:hypothetical protein
VAVDSNIMNNIRISIDCLFATFVDTSARFGRVPNTPGVLIPGYITPPTAISSASREARIRAINSPAAPISSLDSLPRRSVGNVSACRPLLVCD